MNNQRVWFITGVSGGLGRAIALAAAAKGDLVYGTVRKPEQMADFESQIPGFTKAVLLDINNHEAVKKVVAELLEQVGIDVLVNNAGYGLFGAIEEVTMDECRKQMETNFFSALHLCQIVLPYMRRAGKGHIVQISSIAGFRGTEGLGIYNASKFALEGFSQALQKEVKPFGIHVTLVEPGPFRTEWGGSSSIRSHKTMPEYADTAGLRIRTIHGYSGTQPGDPAKAADVILSVVNHPEPPMHLPLGAFAIEGFRDKMKALQAEINAWEKLSTATSF
ncbi:MAG: SDR family NAD(P)-dependent oxidoreductase [Bacteroidetes bacterium]|nr:SDR family NAD(P)-dependent oxidoreductase [Bacteroidota bacterium]